MVISALGGTVALYAGYRLILKIRKRHHTQTKDHSYRELFDREWTQVSQELHVLIRAEDHTPVYISENLESILGLRTEAVQTDLEALKRVLDRADCRRYEQAEAAWNRQTSLNMELPYKNLETGEQRWGELSLTRAQDERFYLLCLRDMTREHEIREKLQQEADQAYQAEKSKTAFLSQMSHEIRTPMNGVLGMISLAKLNLLKPEESRDYLNQAENLSQFLLSLINDILDMSRIESGKVELEAVKFDLFGMAGKIRAMFERTIEEKGIKFVLEMQDFNIRYVVGDELRLTQVVVNFLSNSSKFTPKGGQITVTFRQMHIIDGKVQLMIRVRDTGKGMAPEFLSKIFKPFVQESTTVTKTYGGSGLGMAISDNLITLMGGNIVIDSELGKGSDFTIYIGLPVAEGDQTLPEEGALEQEETEKDTFTLEGLRILMAEDNKVNTIIAEKLLANQGATVESVVNGLEAVKRFAEVEPGYYDIILMDIKMPEMDGWQATANIRAMDKADAKTIPIFALSADAFVEDKRHSIEMGMTGHIAKPIDFNELKKEVRKSLGR